MNKKINNVYIKPLLFLLSMMLVLLNLSCRTNQDDQDSEDPDDTFYISRPKIIVDSPLSKLPYTLKWEENRLVRSYEIQSASNLEFTENRQHWTTKENSLLIEEMKNEVLYIRIKAHFDNDSSRWSEVLKMNLDGDELRLTWLRS